MSKKIPENMVDVFPSLLLPMLGARAHVQTSSLEEASPPNSSRGPQGDACDPRAPWRSSHAPDGPGEPLLSVPLCVPPELVGVIFLSAPRGQTVTLSHGMDRHTHGQGAQQSPHTHRAPTPRNRVQATGRPCCGLELIRALSHPDAARVCELGGSFQWQAKQGCQDRGQRRCPCAPFS